MNKYILLFLKVLATFIMIQTLYFKFTGASESVYLFTKLIRKNEAFMRVGIGILELITSILLFVPNKTWLVLRF